MSNIPTASLGDTYEFYPNDESFFDFDSDTNSDAGALLSHCATRKTNAKVRAKKKAKKAKAKAKAKKAKDKAKKAKAKAKKAKARAKAKAKVDSDSDSNSDSDSTFYSDSDSTSDALSGGRATRKAVANVKVKINPNPLAKFKVGQSRKRKISKIYTEDSFDPNLKQQLSVLQKKLVQLEKQDAKVGKRLNQGGVLTGWECNRLIVEIGELKQKITNTTEAIEQLKQQLAYTTGTVEDLEKKLCF